MENRLQAVPVIHVSTRQVSPIKGYLITAGMCCTFITFCGLWILNGHFTAITTRSVAYLVYKTPISWESAWLIHLTIWILGHYLWALLDRIPDAPRLLVTCLQVVIIVCGVVDVLTSAFALLAWSYFYGYDLPGMAGNVLYTVLAIVIVIIPKPVIAILADTLWQTFTE